MKMGMSPPSFSLVLLAGFLLSGCAAGNYSAPVEDASHAGGPSTSESDSGADADAQSEESEESGVRVFAYSQPQQTSASPAPTQMEGSSYGSNSSDQVGSSQSVPESNYGPSSSASESAPSETGENPYGPATGEPQPSSSSKYSFSAPTEGRANAPAPADASQYAAPADASPGFQDDPSVKAGQSSPVASLLALADTQVSSGDFALAAASLERALRIEPKNAILWHELAKVRLDQSQWDETESLALKSNSLAAGGQSRLVASNWRMIAEARRRNGNPQGAAEADAQANKAE